MGSVRKLRKFDTSNESLDIQADIGKRKRLHLKDLIQIQPKTENQAKFMDAWSRQIPLIVQSGSAGAGKTFLALYAAMHDVLDPAMPQEKVIIVRSIVQSRNMGFTSGDVEDKCSWYEAPYQKILADITIFNDPYEMTKSLGYLEFHSTSFLRGTTFDDAVLICDEAQNLDREELRTVLTRVGENTKVIICGDIKQNDLQRYKQTSSANYLDKLVDLLPEDVAEKITYTMEDCVRSGLAREILIADDKIV